MVVRQTIDLPREAYLRKNTKEKREREREREMGAGAGGGSRDVCERSMSV